MTRFRDPQLQELEQRCNAEALRFCQVIFPQGYLAGSEFVIGGIDGKEGDSLLINIRSGIWMDFAASEYRGNILNLVYYTIGDRDWGKTFKSAREILRLRDWAPTKPNTTIVSNEDKRAKAAQVWDMHRPIAGTVAEIYLENRDLGGAARLRNIGFVSKCFWRWWEKVGTGEINSKPEGIKHEGSAPALVARLVDLHGTFQAIHRIYLTPEGQKAQMPLPKVALGMQHGSACRLQGEDFRVIFASEGIEDGAAAALAAPALTVWATPSGPMLGNIQVPPETRVLLSGGDNDHEGEWAFERQKARYADRKDLVIVRAAPIEHDWNEDKQRHGDKAVADRLRSIYREAMATAERA